MPSSVRKARFLVLFCLTAGGMGVAAGAGADPATCLARLDPTDLLAGARPASMPSLPGRLGSTSLELVPALVAGEGEPSLLLAQRAIQHDEPAPPAVAPGAVGKPGYTYVDVKGWRSPGRAAALSFVVPGTGQLYSGSSRGYLLLGFEAVALFSYAKFRSDRNDKRAEYFTYVGDPNDAGSRFSFDRLSSSVDAGEVARLRAIYANDPREFYDLVASDNRYAGGWVANPADGNPVTTRNNALDFADEVDRLGRKSRLGLFVAMANHLVAAADALHLARLNNIALQDNLSLKLRLKPGARGSYTATLVRKF